MNNKKASGNHSREVKQNIMPDLQIIDLDKALSENEKASNEETPQSEDNSRRVNLHIVFLIVLLILILSFIGGLIYKFMTWGKFIDQDDLFQDGPGAIDNSLDLMLPLLDENHAPIYQKYDEDSTIVFFGNAPFADDRDSEDNLVNMIQEMTGATVYNCSVSGSYLAALQPSLNSSQAPMDIFNFYWLCQLAANDIIDEKYLEGLAVLGDDAPPEAMDVYNTLNALDFNTVDAIVIMYDASDYLAGHEMYSDTNYTDIVQFTGNLEAGIELLKDAYPHIRIIVLSPPYAYGLDENGNYISSDIQRYGWDVLSTYVIKQYQSCSARNVTFVDNLYGTITQDNASEYLTDHLHLNVEGRKLVAQRFVNALNYYTVPDSSDPGAFYSLYRLLLPYCE